MPETTLKQLAKVIGKPVEHLIEQMGKAGLAKKSPGDTVSDEEKIQFIQFLNRGGKVSLVRKTTSQIKVQNKTAGVNTVSIEVRKRKVYGTRRAPAKEVAPPAEMASEAASSAPAPEAPPPRKEKPAKPPAPVESVPVEKPPVPSLPPKAQAGASAAPATRFTADKRSTSKDKAKDKNGPRRELKVAKDKRGKRRIKKKRIRPERVIHPKRQEFEKPTAPIKREVEIPATISVGALAQNLAIKSGVLVKEMIGMGMMATINQTLDRDTATLIVEELGHIPKPVGEEDIERSLLSDKVQGSGLTALPRSPVVAVMGHVDHGKTSLLDYIRKSRVADTESGGITQHIGAYNVKTDKGNITFLDTPGHAAFTSMRARGAGATDIVVLMVAADDGVMPQTEEAIQHSRTAQTPIVVAVNKIDKENADPDKVRNDLGQRDLIPEAWGGDTIYVNISAKTGKGIDDLLDAILLQAEMMDLKAPVEGLAQGTVIESALDKGRGAFVTVLVQQGLLKKGDVLLAGQEFGRVRALLDENGNTLDKVGPSTPTVVIGLSGTPPAGEKVQVLLNERKAREIADFRSKKIREGKLASQRQSSAADNIFERLEGTKVPALNLLIKADVQGSAEALRDSLNMLSTDEVQAKIILSGIGGINESDVDLAAASSAVIIGFNVRADAKARKTAQLEDLQIRYYSVIYEALDDVRQMMSGMLKPEVKERILGTAEVKDIFQSSKMGVVAGCRVIEGVIRQSNPIRVLRDNVVIFEGELESLRRHKDDVNEVNSGTECGIAVKNYEDVKPGDNIEVYERVEVQREL